ncbi:MAG: FeoA family protein [Candidatus Omnitrophota bacterium]
MSELVLTKVKAKNTVLIKKINGGSGIQKRLESLGIRPGKKVKLISSHFLRGPVTIMIGRARVAIGHGMAQKIIVELTSK